jgi:uncharacterized protein YecA (UPF0149 family)
VSIIYIAYIIALVTLAAWPWKREIKPIEPVPKEIADHIFTTRYRAPRNSPCPCVSGKKFKVCHAQ